MSRTIPKRAAPCTSNIRPLAMVATARIDRRDPINVTVDDKEKAHKKEAA